MAEADQDFRPDRKVILVEEIEETLLLSDGLVTPKGYAGATLSFLNTARSLLRQRETILDYLASFLD